MGNILITMWLGILYGASVAIRRMYYMYTDTLFSKIMIFIGIVWIFALVGSFIGMTINYMTYDENDEEE